MSLNNKKHDKQYVLNIYDGHGNVVQSRIIRKNDHKFIVIFDLSANQDGIYYLHVSDGTKTIVRAIIKN